MVKKPKIETLTTLVNTQGTRIEELTNMVKAIPSTPPTPSFTIEDRTEERAADSSQPQGEQPPPEKTQSGTHQILNLSTSSDSNHLPISIALSKPSTLTQITDNLIAELNLNQPASSSPKPSDSQPNPETQTNLNIIIFPESIAEDMVTLFPHNTNFAYEVRPLNSVPQQPQTQQPSLELIIPLRPTILTQPRTTTSALSSPTAPTSPKVIPEEGNLTPPMSSNNQGRHQGDQKNTSARRILSGQSKYCSPYLPVDVLEEHRLAQEALERKMIQDCEDLKIVY